LEIVQFEFIAATTRNWLIIIFRETFLPQACTKLTWETDTVQSTYFTRLIPLSCCFTGWYLSQWPGEFYIIGEGQSIRTWPRLL